MKRRYWVVTTVLTLLGSATLFAHWWAAPEVPARTRGAVTLAPPQSERVKVRVTGELSALNEIDTKSTLAGTVRSIGVKTGERVRANSIVAIVEPSDRTENIGALEAALQSAQDDWTEKKEQLAVIEWELARAEQWLREDLIARRDLEQATRRLTWRAPKPN